MRRANGRSQRRFSNGERRIATDGRGRSSSVPGGRGRRRPVLDAEPLELALLDERGDRGANARGAAARSPVLDDPALGQRPAGVHGTERERAQALRLRRRRRVEDGGGQDALGDVVEPLEALSSGDDEVAVVPEELEHLLRRLPAPHRPGARRRRSGASRAGRARGSPRGRARGGADAFGRPVRTTGVRRRPSPGGRAASRRKAGGMPRGPSTRSGGRLSRRETASRRYAPTRAPIAIRWLRSTVEMESSCTHERRRMTASTSAVVPRRCRAAYPCASIAIRRTAVTDTPIRPVLPDADRCGWHPVRVRRFLVVCAVGLVAA